MGDQLLINTEMVFPNAMGCAPAAPTPFLAIIIA